MSRVLGDILHLCVVESCEAVLRDGWFSDVATDMIYDDSFRYFTADEDIPRPLPFDVKDMR